VELSSLNDDSDAKNDMASDPEVAIPPRHTHTLLRVYLQSIIKTTSPIHVINCEIQPTSWKAEEDSERVRVARAGLGLASAEAPRMRPLNMS
jgi:hypothetical protein